MKDILFRQGWTNGEYAGFGANMAAADIQLTKKADLNRPEPVAQINCRERRLKTEAADRAA
jgi:hypothetical protein